MSGILSQSTISLKRTYEVGGHTETSEAVSETIYTADPSAFTFSESVHGSEGGIGDYENATTLYDIVGLKNDGGTELTQGKDYTVTCSDNTAVGTAKATVDFSGNYFGTKTVYFDIAYAELPEGSTISDYASVPSPNENGWYSGDIVITAEGGASVGFTEDTASISPSPTTPSRFMPKNSPSTP